MQPHLIFAAEPSVHLPVTAILLFQNLAELRCIHTKRHRHTYGTCTNQYIGSRIRKSRTHHQEHNNYIRHCCIQLTMPLWFDGRSRFHDHLPSGNHHVAFFDRKQNQYKFCKRISRNQICQHHSLHSLIGHRVKDPSELADTVKRARNPAVQNIRSCCRDHKQYKQRPVLYSTISLKSSQKQNSQNETYGT